MNLVGLATRNLKRRPIRTSLSILGIGLAVGAALALIALSRSIQDSTREGMNELGDDLVVMQKGASAAGERHVVVLGDTAAAALGKKLGDEIELIDQRFRVVGIASYTTVVNRGLVLVPLADLQEASYRPQQVTIIHVNVEHASGRGVSLGREVFGQEEYLHAVKNRPA